MQAIQEKAKVSFISDLDFAESYNSAYRAIVSKPVNEKYARKLIQDKLKNHGLNGINVTTLYKNYNGTDSKQEDCWIFGLQIPPQVFMFNSRALEALHLESEATR